MRERGNRMSEIDYVTRELRPAWVQYEVPEQYKPTGSTDPAPCLRISRNDQICLEPVVTLACGAKVVSSRGLSTNYTSRNPAEIISLHKSGVSVFSSLEVPIQWSIHPSLPLHSPLTFDHTTGVLKCDRDPHAFPHTQTHRHTNGRANAQTYTLGSSLSQEPDTASRKVYTITAKNIGGSARTRLTLKLDI